MGGGTGLFFDKAEPLPYEIEHHMPDYNLYDTWVKQQIEKGVKPKALKDYTDRYIGYTTRGCIRGCKFCVNQNTRESVLHSPVSEFYDPSLQKPVICLNDDNVLACKDWKKIFEDLISTGKRFYYKQGLDERLLDDEKCEYLFNQSKYYGDYTFAFDRYKDRNLIERKLEMIRKYTNKQCVFYVLCGFDETGRYDKEFWKRDLIETFERIKILGSYGCLPYIMRFNKYEESPYRGIYITLARWCNQFSYFKKESLYEYVTITDYNSGGRASQKYLEHLENTAPEIYNKYVFEKFYFKS